jgi:prevent-host-death family protein
MKTIGVTEFRARCLSILERLDAGGYVITKCGRPVARLLPVGAERPHRGSA